MNAQTASKIEDINVTELELIDVDMPFNTKEVETATSRRYVEQLTRSDMPIPRCSEMKTSKGRSRAAVATDHVFDPIDVDIPFSAAEVAELTCEAYVAALGRSDMPVIGRLDRF